MYVYVRRLKKLTTLRNFVFEWFILKGLHSRNISVEGLVRLGKYNLLFNAF